MGVMRTGWGGGGAASFVTVGTGGSGAFGVGGSTGRVTAGFSWLTGVGIVTKEISYAASGRSIFPGKRNPEMNRSART